MYPHAVHPTSTIVPTSTNGTDGDNNIILAVLATLVVILIVIIILGAIFIFVLLRKLKKSAR